jgi:adenine-specific DNA-methyltransferase
VTYERFKRVINKEKYAAKLKYFKVDYVPITEEGYWERAEALLKYIRELVELENGIDFVHDKSVAIVLTDEEAEMLLKDKKRLSVCKTVYRGHNVMFSAKMNARLSSCGIEVRMIPDYYYPELED